MHFWNRYRLRIPKTRHLRRNLFGRHFGNSKLPSLNTCLAIYLLLIYNNKELLISMPLLVLGYRDVKLLLRSSRIENSGIDYVWCVAWGRCLWIRHSTSDPKLFLLQKNSPCTHLYYVHISLWTSLRKILSRITSPQSSLRWASIWNTRSLFKTTNRKKCHNRRH